MIRSYGYWVAKETIQKFRQRELNLVPRSAKATSSESTSKLPNPFIPHLNPTTRKWAPPRYSLRRQAELVKKAKRSETLHLLPAGPKFLPSQLQKLSKPTPSEPSEEAAWEKENIEWEGEVKEKVVPGADIGARLYAGKKRMFKGHKWQRTEEKRSRRTKILMRDMDKRVERFKSSYRRRKPSPLSRPRATSKNPKLPF